MLSDHSGREPLAIVGIGCRLPGGSDSVDSLWNLLCSETDATSVVPESRWNADRYHDPNPAKVGKIVARRGGFLSEIDQFDPQSSGSRPVRRIPSIRSSVFSSTSRGKRWKTAVFPPTASPGATSGGSSSAASPSTINCYRTKAVPVATGSRRIRPPA